MEDYKTLFYSKKCDGKRGGHTVEDLKVICRTLNLKTSGTKEVLCNQIKDFFQKKEESSSNNVKKIEEEMSKVSISKKNSIKKPKESSKKKEQDIISEIIRPVEISHELRRKNIEFLIKLLDVNTSLGKEKSKEKAIEIERGIFNYSSNNSIYRERALFVISNINPKNKSVNNSGLIEKIISGVLSPYELGFSITAEELMPERHVKPHIIAFKRITEDELEAMPDGIIKCGKCKSMKTFYYELQTRSADEPTSKYVTCIKCDNRFVIN